MTEKKVILGLFVALFVLIADQVSKYFVFKFIFENGSPFEVCPYFNIVTAFNKGVSFSMFQGGGVWSRVVLVALALLVVAFLFYWLAKEKSRFVQICLALIIGGALGNVTDRLRLGAVYDFLDFHFGAYHWPAFNLADTFICIGAFLIVIQALFCKKKIR
ncbi:MAG: signal peptidase II [Alphaproteobacteria bacterium]|nr:signal peptidase II [Alphaproteobacteria bacterium]